MNNLFNYDKDGNVLVSTKGRKDQVEKLSEVVFKGLSKDSSIDEYIDRFTSHIPTGNPLNFIYAIYEKINSTLFHPLSSKDLEVINKYKRSYTEDHKVNVIVCDSYVNLWFMISPLFILDEEYDSMNTANEEIVYVGKINTAHQTTLIFVKQTIPVVENALFSCTKDIFDKMIGVSANWFKADIFPLQASVYNGNIILQSSEALQKLI